MQDQYAAASSLNKQVLHYCCLAAVVFLQSFHTAGRKSMTPFTAATMLSKSGTSLICNGLLLISNVAAGTVLIIFIRSRLALHPGSSCSHCLPADRLLFVSMVKLYLSECVSVTVSVMVHVYLCRNHVSAMFTLIHPHVCVLFIELHIPSYSEVSFLWLDALHSGTVLYF